MIQPIQPCLSHFQVKQDYQLRLQLTLTPRLYPDKA